MKKIELLSPAGNLEKLQYAYLYGADAAYIGLPKISLRNKNEEFDYSDAKKINDIKKGKKLYLAANMLCYDKDIDEFIKNIPLIKRIKADGFIVSDMGLAMTIKEHFPNTPLHLSTQASCINSRACKFYKNAGFKRIILGREASIDDIKRIKDTIPELEIEVFVHGAMCMSISGRCFLSKFLSKRSANRGLCTHSCRWEYRYAIEERQRPGEFMPIEEDEKGWTHIFSSKDLCMIDHLDDLIKSGVDSLKIEGRMKSAYYVAMVTRAYRKALDKDPSFDIYKNELYNVSHREYITGFFYDNKDDLVTPGEEEYKRNYILLGTIDKKIDNLTYKIKLKNLIKNGETIEFAGKDYPFIVENNITLLNKDMIETDKLSHQDEGFIRIKKPLKLNNGDFIRREITN